MRKTKWAHASPFIILFCIYVAFFWRQLFFQSLTPYDGDIPLFFYPSWAVGKRLLLQGATFLWDPYRNMGQPFLASPQNQALYPLRVLSLWTTYFTYQRIYILFHMLLSAFGGALFMKKWTEDKAAWALAAIGFAFNGFFYWRVIYSSDYASLAWAPMVLSAVVWKKPRLFALAFFCQLLTGFPPFSILTLVAAGLIVFIDNERKSAFISFLKGLLYAGGLSALIGLPFFEMLHEAARPVFLNSTMALEKSLSPMLLIRMLTIPTWILPMLPPFHTSLRSFYFGSIFLGLSVYGALTLRGRKKALPMAIVAALLLSTGDHFPFYRWIPGITIFRYPLQFNALTTLLIIPLAAHALSRISRSHVKWILIICSALEFAHYTTQTTFIWAHAESIGESSHKMNGLNDQYSPHRIFHTFSITDKNQQWDLRSKDTMDFMQGILTPSLAAAQNQKEVISHHNLTSRRILEYAGRLNYSAPSSPLFAYADVDRIVALTPSGAEKVTPSWEDVGLIKNKNAAGRAFFIGGNGIIGNITIDKPGHLQLQTTGGGQLVFPESFYPGWKATIDKKNTPLFPFEKTFLSLNVGEGTHQIDFFYQPLSFYLGLIIFLLTTVLIIFKNYLKWIFQILKSKATAHN